MEFEEDDKPEPAARQAVHLTAPYAALLRTLGSVEHRSGVGEVEYALACRARDCGLEDRMVELGIPWPSHRGGIVRSMTTEEALAERLYEAWRAEYVKAAPSQATWAQLRGHRVQEEVEGWLAVARLVLGGGGR